MRTVIDLLNVGSAAWGTLVVAGLWQSTLLAVVVVAAARVLRRSAPGVRYWLWQIVAIKLLVIPLWSWSLAWPWPAVSSDDALAWIAPRAVAASAMQHDGPQFLAAAAETRQTQADSTGMVTWAGRFKAITWRSWLFLGWGALVGLQIVRLVAMRRRLSRLLRQSTPPEAELIAMARDVVERLQLKRPPAVLLTAVAGSPFACGVLRPKLVLPQALVGMLSAAEWPQVLAHELAHVKRRDLIWGWIPEIARVLYFFHPVAHWVDYRIRLERELACDQLAMATSGRGPAEYADTLVRVVSSTSWGSIVHTSVAVGLDGNAPPPFKAEQQPCATARLAKQRVSIPSMFMVLGRRRWIRNPARA